MRTTWSWSLLVWCACSASDARPDGPSAATVTSAITTVGAVLTQHNDVGRTGVNPSETHLTQAAVSGNFGKVATFTAPVGKIFAQPLFAPAVATPSGTYDLLIVVTEANNVYALDAVSGAVIWSFNAGTPIPAGDAYSAGRFALGPTIGITGTPVIDPAAGVIYFVAATKTGASYEQKLHALNLATGTPFVAPHAISAALPGTGPFADGGLIHFDPLRQNQRPGLLLQGGKIYVAWSSHDSDDLHTPHLYEGWFMSFSATSLAALHQFMTNPNPVSNPINGIGYGGGIWMSGGGPASDGSRIFLSTGNGDSNGSSNYGDAVLAFDANLSLVDFFEPGNATDLYANDFDFSAGGVVVLQGGPAGHPNLIAACGKAGDIYLLDRTSLGGAMPSHATGVSEAICPTLAPKCVVAEIVQAFLPVAQHGAAYYGLPAFFNHRLYYVGWGTHMQMYGLNTGGISDTGARSVTTFQYPGATPSVSGSTLQNGVVWAIERTAVNPGVTPDPSHLHAYKAMDLTELYASHGTDDPAAPNQFETPTIAGGRVYVAGDGVDVYGTLLNPPAGVSTQQGRTITFPLATAARPTPVTYNLTAANLPAGMTVSFSPASITSGASATVTVIAATTLPPAAYTIAINGGGQSAPVVVTVLPQ